MNMHLNDFLNAQTLISVVDITGSSPPEHVGKVG